MMETLINITIQDILTKREDILPFFLRKKSKFEGWLKFELALSIESGLKMDNVEVETKNEHNKCRCDISFSFKDVIYRIELKTSNTNWKTPGVISSRKGISKNIKSIINDAKKLNCPNGIVSFVLFPIPLNNDSWKKYIKRISEETEIHIDESHCTLLEVNVDAQNKCNLLICSFRSKNYTEKVQVAAVNSDFVQ